MLNLKTVETSIKRTKQSLNSLVVPSCLSMASNTEDENNLRVLSALQVTFLKNLAIIKKYGIKLLLVLILIISIIGLDYSIVNGSNADLGVIFRILQNSPITKAVCTKISKKIFLHFWQNFDISNREN